MTMIILKSVYDTHKFHVTFSWQTYPIHYCSNTTWHMSCGHQSNTLVSLYSLFFSILSTMFYQEYYRKFYYVIKFHDQVMCLIVFWGALSQTRGIMEHWQFGLCFGGFLVCGPKLSRLAFVSLVLDSVLILNCSSRYFFHQIEM